MTVTAVETSSKLSNYKEIKVVSNRRELNNINQTGGLDFKEFTELKKSSNKKIEKYLDLYKKSNDNKKKIEILEKYNEEISNNIKNIYNGGGENEDFNKINIEKYFFNVYLLLESDEEILYLNSDENKKNNILEEIKTYISKFKFQSIYYIKEIINLFKYTKREIFLEIFYFSIKTLNESASDYLKNLKKNCKYFSKLYYEEVIKLYKEYIEEEDSIIDIINKIDEEKRESEIELNKINSNAFLLINLSKQKQKLIDTNLSGNYEREINLIGNWGSGFTYNDDLLNLDNGSLSNEDYNIIYDELERMYDEIIDQIKKDEDYDDNKKKELIEQKGICYGNMAKIKLKYQKEKDYSKYKNLIDKCIDCAKQCSKDDDDCEWYKEALELQKEIELKDKNNPDEEKEIMVEVNKQIDNLSNTFECGRIRFIDEVLSNFPYDGYNKYNDNFFNNDNELTIEQIDFLIKKYDPDKYRNNTKEEKILYKIIVFISQKLNEIKTNLENKLI